MIPFYVICVVNVVSLFLWHIREQQHARQIIELSKLIKSHDLSDFEAGGRTVTRQNNFMKDAIDRAYAQKYEGDLDA